MFSPRDQRRLGRAVRFTEKVPKLSGPEKIRRGIAYPQLLYVNLTSTSGSAGGAGTAASYEYSCTVYGTSYTDLSPTWGRPLCQVTGPAIKGIGRLIRSGGTVSFELIQANEIIAINNCEGLDTGSVD